MLHATVPTILTIFGRPELHWPLPDLGSTLCPFLELQDSLEPFGATEPSEQLLRLFAISGAFQGGSSSEVASVGVYWKDDCQPTALLFFSGHSYF